MRGLAFQRIGGPRGLPGRIRGRLPPVVVPPVGDGTAVNLSLPRIDGWPVSRSTVSLSVGSWEGDIDHFEVELLADVGPALIPRQQADNTTEFAIDDVEGKTLTYVVYAIDSNGGGTRAESAPFGPIQPGDELILAFALAGTEDSRDAVTNVPYPVEVVYGSTSNKLYPQPNPNHDGLSWGYTSGGANINGLANVIDYDPRLAGRFASNSTSSMQIDIPAHDTYVLYASMGVLGSNSVNLGVFAGGRSGRSLHQIGPTPGGGANRVVDASGVSRPVPEWVGLSAPGGEGVDLIVGGTGNPDDPLFITIGRSSLEGSSTPHTIYGALFRKVS